MYTYVHFLDKPKTRDMIAGYNEWHPFMGVLWIALFLLVRNCCAAFRGRILYAFEFLGKYSLELYLLQFHLLLSKSATRLLVLIEGYPYTNLAILFVFYVFAAMRTHELTLYLRSVFFSLKSLFEYAATVCICAVAIGANYATNGSTPRTQILVACALGMGIAIVTILLAARNAPKASTEANEDKRVDKNMAQTPVDLSVVAYDAGGSIADHDENDHNGIELGAVAPAAGERRSAASQSDDRSNGSALDRCYIVFLALFAILIPVGMRELQRAWPVRPTIDAPSPITYAPTEAGNDAATNSSATSSPTLSPSLSPTEGKNLAFDVEEARETVLGLRTALEDYWRGNTALLHSVYLSRLTLATLKALISSPIKWRVRWFTAISLS